jgi:SAM-dependent methyltransferase
LSFQPSSFDGIWCSCVLQHVPLDDAKSAIAGLVDKLRPGGVIYLLAKEGAREGLEKDSRFNNDTKFSSYFQAGEIHDWLLEAGLEVKKIKVWRKTVDPYRHRKRIFALAEKPNS